MPQPIVAQFFAGSPLNASGTAQDLMRYTLQANSLSTNKRLRIIVDGVISTGLSVLATVTINAIFGSDSLSLGSGLTLLTSLSNAPFQIVYELTANNSTSSQQVTVKWWETFTVAGTTKPRIVHSTFTRNTTTAQDIATTVTFSGLSTGTTITRNAAIIEMVG